MYNYCLWPKWPEGQRNDAKPIIKYKLHMHTRELHALKWIDDLSHTLFPETQFSSRYHFLWHILHPAHIMWRPQTRGPCHGPFSPRVCFVVALDWSGSWIVIVFPGKVNIIWIMIEECLCCWSDVFAESKASSGNMLSIFYALLML